MAQKHKQNRTYENHFVLNFDGSCLGNPDGQMGYGCIVYNKTTNDRKEYWGGDKPCIGNTNNISEYKGLILGLEQLQDVRNSKIIVYGDSKMVVNQMNGDYRVKATGKGKYVPYAKIAQELIGVIVKNKNYIEFRWVPREQNEYADELSNRFHEGNNIDVDFRTMMKRMREEN